MVQAIPGTTDADRLAEQMRAIAADPRNVIALVSAGELSLKLDDLSGAASLFARADKIDPRSGRVKAGEGALMLRSERPGEALRFFQQAESFGWTPNHYAAERALAYDLLGEQQRAQRDYRLALKQEPNDEAVRNYALSLGISGQKDQALDQLAPLLRRQDRGAWRARAFILAMNGDLAGASTIATTMMPPSMAQGLQPFFERLPELGAIDRAFAVHFGEVRPTPERLADARLAPVLSPLPRESSMPAQVASAAKPIPTPDRRDTGRRRLRALPAPAANAGATGPATVPLTTRRTTSASDQQPGRASYAAADSRIPSMISSPPVRQPENKASGAAQVTDAVPAIRQSGGQAPSPIASAAITSPVSTPARESGRTAQASVSTAPPPTATRPATQLANTATPASRDSESAILAKIVAGLPIPASELAVTPPDVSLSPDPVPARTTARGPAPIARAVPSQPLKPSEKIDPATLEEKPIPTKTKRSAVTGEKAEAPVERVETPAEKRAAARKAALVEKKEAEKKAADKKAAEKKAAEVREARTNPSRIWVQLAGGANEDSLQRAFSAVKVKAPEVMDGHAGYSTPLRATNRVLTGPFKTDAEAQSFINKLAKKGVSAFSFTSDKGQKVERLSAK